MRVRRILTPVTKSPRHHGKLQDRILVVDVESTCWKGDTPLGERSEIIQIGTAFIDVETNRREEDWRQSIMVRPVVSSVSSFCTELTGLTQERVLEGKSFGEACHHLRENYLSNGRVWASYGDYDRTMFEKGCAPPGPRYPFGKRHLNVKALFALVMALDREVGLPKALEIAGLPLEGRLHDGGDDAWNIAGLLVWILQRARVGSEVGGKV